MKDGRRGAHPSKDEAQRRLPLDSDRLNFRPCSIFERSCAKLLGLTSHCVGHQRWRSPVLTSLLFLAAIESTAPASPGSATAGTGQLDYHRRCQPKERGGCSHWEGLSCGEVDSILLNVRRYEKQAQHQDLPMGVASSPISLAPSSMPPAADAAIGDSQQRLPVCGDRAGPGVSLQSMQSARDQPHRPPPQPLTEAVYSQGMYRASVYYVWRRAELSNAIPTMRFNALPFHAMRCIPAGLFSPPSRNAPSSH